MEQNIAEILGDMPTSKLIALHREYSIKWNEAFNHGTPEELTKVCDLLEYIEQYIASRCR